MDKEKIISQMLLKREIKRLRKKKFFRGLNKEEKEEYKIYRCLYKRVGEVNG